MLHGITLHMHCTLNCPGLVIVITPPYAQFSMHGLLSIGLWLHFTRNEPGAHGPGMTGTHGIGVRTPIAAVVAEATVGLANEVHTPAGTRFTIGAFSMAVATGM